MTCRERIFAFHRKAGYNLTLLDEKEGERQNVAAFLHQLRVIHQEQGNYEEAVNYYQKSLKIFKQLNDPNREIAERSIARLREKMGEEAFETALKKLRRQSS